MIDSSGLIERTGRQLNAAEVYAIWAIRDAVFAVEQQCDELDVDGVDLLPTCTHLWFADEAGITSYLRTFPTVGGERRIGRVATRADARGQGLAGMLLCAVITRWGSQSLLLGAQTHLFDWYARFGFERAGQNYREAGIEHTPMRRSPTLDDEAAPDAR